MDVNSHLPVFTNDELAVALQNVRAEFASKVAGQPQLTVQQAIDIREYAKSRTDLDSGNLSAEQAAWKTLYESLTEELRKSAPDTMAEVEPLERQMDSLQSLQNLMKAKLDARPNDLGYRVPIAFLIVGGLIGWFVNASLWSVAVCSIASWISGILFALFVTDSAQVQSDLANRMKALGWNRTLIGCTCVL